jgi:predicted CopG family antitoxin
MHTLWEARMQKRMTISIDEAVYDGLVRVVGRRNMSRFLEDLARPHVVKETLDEAYAALVLDREREAEALAWNEALIGDGVDAAR